MAPNEKGMIMMACAEKFGAGAVRNILRHNRREIEHSSNHDIDPKGWSGTIYYPQTGA